MLDEVRQQLYAFFVLFIDVELQDHCVEVNGYLRAPLRGSKGIVVCLNCIEVSDVNRVRIPRISILDYKLLRQSLH